MPIVEKIESIHIQKEIDKIPISKPEQQKPISILSTPTVPTKSTPPPLATVAYTAQQIYSMNWREFEVFIAKILNEYDM